MGDVRSVTVSASDGVLRVQYGGRFELGPMSTAVEHLLQLAGATAHLRGA